LKDYVAVNPYLGFVAQEFLSARHLLRSVSDFELLMSADYYRQQFAEGAFSRADIDAAVDELVADGVAGAERIDVNQIVAYLREPLGPTPAADAEFESPSNPDRQLRTFAEQLDEHTSSDWSRLIRDEISKHCATHYDQGQATWSSDWQRLPLYQAWQMAAQHDRNIEILGIRGVRNLVAHLPQQPQAAVVELLTRLGVPQKLWADFLLCEALTMPGWIAWTKFQHRQAAQQGAECSDLAGLLAMRLAYEAALSEKCDFHVDWPAVEERHTSLVETVGQRTDELLLRYALLKASEIAFRQRLIADLSNGQPAAAQDHATQRTLAQMVFCIDVRSERIRRHLEAGSNAIETFGFAGFFGLPIEFVELGQSEGSSQVPVLISPQFKVYENLCTPDASCQEAAGKRRATWRFVRKSWKTFQASAMTTFAFVETAGLLYGPKLIARSLGLDLDWPSRFDGVPKADRGRLAPSLRGLNQQGVDVNRQVDMAESILRGIGIVDHFARLVVFCGHGSQTANNPLKSGLDCGACGGHSGEANARLAAKLLNQPYVRSALADRGIEIPTQTQFVAALHNTTTDRLEFFDTHLLPLSHDGDLKQLQSLAEFASKQTRDERRSVLPGRSVEDLVRRSRDWSEVRPEWGLAGNAAFIAAPRELTEGVSLEGRVFLHSYDHSCDPNSTVLEQIMTAPLVVANWINLQYYASTVDPVHSGSGNKTVHNVVGQFGIFSGNGGDLTTGLPWQSIHDGTRYQHHPLRLLAVIAAPRAAIEAVLEKHPNVACLLTNGWMQLTAIEDGSYFRLTEQQQWEALASIPTPQFAC
jgi:uncharacterized protein YbcC (UPF0753/DUF2309 family)